jgi:L-ornithine N5-oxygenase
MGSIHGDGPVLDILGVGFGPSNIALAIAVAEHNANRPAADRLSARFAERQPAFGWHTGMLIEGSRMQIPFLKDLATLRNPASDFSFVSYLDSKGRLVDFVNHKTLFPSRLEFHDYLSWCAGRLEPMVSYSATVVDVAPVTVHDQVRCLDVHCAGPGTPVIRTRNLVLATGLVPSVPPGVHLSDRIWHSSQFLHQLVRLSGPPARVMVVGAGQSAAEIVASLHERFPQAEVTSVFTRYGYSTSDDTPFANGVFDPAAMGLFFESPTYLKDRILQYHGNTNYSVVDADLIAELYRRAYAEKVQGTQRLHIRNLSRLNVLGDAGNGVVVDIEFLPTGEVHRAGTDILIFATGYRPMDDTSVLGGISNLCKRDGDGRLRVSRDHRVEMSEIVKCGVFLQGGTEHTHGLSSSLLSNSAVRAGEILDAVVS